MNLPSIAARSLRSAPTLIGKVCRSSSVSGCRGRHRCGALWHQPREAAPDARARLLKVPGIMQTKIRHRLCWMHAWGVMRPRCEAFADAISVLPRPSGKACFRIRVVQPELGLRRSQVAAATWEAAFVAKLAENYLLNGMLRVYDGDTALKLLQSSGTKLGNSGQRWLLELVWLQSQPGETWDVYVRVLRLSSRQAPACLRARRRQACEHQSQRLESRRDCPSMGLGSR